MSIPAERVEYLPFSKNRSPIDVLDKIPRPKDARIYSHGELVRVFGKDYREKARSYFVDRRILKPGTELVWTRSGGEGYTHPYSAANYLLWRVEGNDLVIVSAIPPRSLTSFSHTHPLGVVETYGCLSGSFQLHTDDGDMVITMAKGAREQSITSGVRHVVETKDSWALIPIVITNGALHRPEDLHRR